MYFPLSITEEKYHMRTTHGYTPKKHVQMPHYLFRLCCEYTLVPLSRLILEP